MKIIFLRHFRTKVDRNKPVAEWGLDEEGKKAMQQLLATYDFSKISSIISSPEPKALITAKAIGGEFSKEIIEEPLISEVDRSKAGFIEGDYTEVVKRYFSSYNFEYAWEPIEAVRERIRKAERKIALVSGNPLIISHGMFLSLMLAPLLGKEVISFWKNLGFGEIIEVDRALLPTY
ncbi:MAG: histidine phosphatase family protein [Candidatus Woesearchaeota archaeon]